MKIAVTECSTVVGLVHEQKIELMTKSTTAASGLHSCRVIDIRMIFNPSLSMTLIVGLYILHLHGTTQHEEEGMNEYASPNPGYPEPPVLNTDLSMITQLITSVLTGSQFVHAAQYSS